MKSRSGLTMLEVIFAMVVILVGMVAIGLLIPLAGREAEDSYQITQGLAAGDSALALFNTTNIAQPSLESPWCLVDDIGGNEHSVSTMQAAYDAAARTFPVPQNRLRAAIAQNEVAGLGFCIDPLFWGFQSRPGNLVPLPFFRTRFPFHFDNTNPVLMVADQQNIPRAARLLRGSLTDPNASTPGSWLRQPAAVRLATMYGGDIVQPSTTKNKALGPIRSVYVAGDGSIVASPASAQQSSWLVTITPSENTPIISADQIRGQFQQNVSFNQPVAIARLYDVALVVFSKRDVREVGSTVVVRQGDLQSQRPAEILNVPSSERVVKVTAIDNEALRSGTFNITVDGYSGMDASIKPGDWLMMSRFAMRDLLPRPSDASMVTKISRQVHRWYRVVGASGNDAFPRTLRVAGKPWDWTEGEIDDFIEKNETLPSVPPLPTAYETHAVILKDVVQVFERQMELR